MDFEAQVAEKPTTSKAKKMTHRSKKRIISNLLMKKRK